MKNKVNKILFENMAPAGKRFYGLEIIIDTEKCAGCGVCAIECPSRIIDMVHKDCGQLISACEKECLCENDVKYALYQMKKGLGEEDAFYIIAERNPFPAVTGRVCSHPCESGCNRAHLDQPVNLHDFERYIGDTAIERKLAFHAPAEKKNKKIAVIGAGPAGLACAFFLAKNGYDVTVYEKEEKPGGVLRYGIPSYRIPENILNAEINRIVELGVHMQTKVCVGKDKDLDDLSKEYDALYLACGRQSSYKLNVPGEEYAVAALDFLKRAHQDQALHLEGDVVIAGGGNVALDAARTAKRSGARTVVVVSLERAHEMPASNDEIAEAKAEGIVFKSGKGIAWLDKQNERIVVSLKDCIRLRDENGRFAPRYQPCDEEIMADMIITAIGQGADLKWLPSDLVQESDRLVPVDERKLTHRSGVFAGGDFTAFDHAGTVSGNIADGRKASEQIREFLGEDVASDPKHDIEGHGDDPEKYYNMQERMQDISSENVKQEADRCLHCGNKKAVYRKKENAFYFNRACQNCKNCINVCKEGAIRFEYSTIQQ